MTDHSDHDSLDALLREQRREARSLLTQEQFNTITKRHDWRSAVALASDWGVIFATWYLAVTYNHWALWVLGVFAVARSQFGLAVLMHDGAPRSSIPQPLAQRQGQRLVLRFPAPAKHPAVPQNASTTPQIHGNKPRSRPRAFQQVPHHPSQHDAQATARCLRYRRS